MAEIKQKFYEKLENFEPENREQWEAVKYSLNVVAQKAVRSDIATATKTTLNAIANAIQKCQHVITKLNDLFEKFFIIPVLDF